MGATISEEVGIKGVSPEDEFLYRSIIQGNLFMVREFWREIITGNLANIVQKNKPNSRRFNDDMQDNIIEQLLDNNDFMEAYKAVHEFGNPETSDAYKHPKYIDSKRNGNLPRRYRKNYGLITDVTLEVKASRPYEIKRPSRGEVNAAAYVGGSASEKYLFWLATVKWPVLESIWDDGVVGCIETLALDIGALLQADVTSIKNYASSASTAHASGHTTAFYKSNFNIACYKAKPTK